MNRPSFGLPSALPAASSRFLSPLGGEDKGEGGALRRAEEAAQTPWGLSRTSIFYVTDAMAAAGAPPGRYTIGPLEVEVGADQLVRQPGKSNYAGSALRPIDGVFRAAAMLGCPWQEVWDAFSTRPASFIGLEAQLKVGAPADFCVVKMAEGNRLDLLETYSGGGMTAVRP